MTFVTTKCFSRLRGLTAVHLVSKSQRVLSRLRTERDRYIPRFLAVPRPSFYT